MNRSLILILFTLCANVCLAQGYPGIVTLSDINDREAVFTSIGIADKKGDVELNALQSLFHTLFYVGVEGINNGKPLIVNDKPAYISNFMTYKVAMYSSNRRAIKEPTKNLSKKFEGVYLVKVPIVNLFKELTLNGVYVASATKTELADVESMNSVVMPTIIVVPYKKDMESYDAILQNDYDRRVAVSKVQAGFESRNITTIDIQAKINAMKRRSEYEASTADSNDKQLLLSSGADVYVDVDILKDIQPSGSRVSLIMKAYEVSTGSILAVKDGFTRRYNTSSLDELCSYAVSDNITSFLDDISKNFNKQVTTSKRVVLQISIGEGSMATLNDQMGKNNYRLSDIIRQWVRSNSEQGKYHLQGVVAESMIFDYVMIPPKDKDGLMMDAAQFGFLLHSYLAEGQNIPCSSKIDGNTIYITIE